MNISRHIQYLFLALTSLIVVGCSEDDIIADIDGESVDVTFIPSLDSVHQSRSIGKAESIDQVVVGVYENNSLRFSLTKTWAEAQNGVSITLIEGRTYQVLFWAQNSANTAYVLTDNGNITVNYDDYTSGGFAKMEELDAFFYVDKFSVGTSKVENRTVVLSRPFAQLNFADNTTRPESGVHRAEITFANIPTAFNPLNGTVTTASLSDPADDVTFTFADFPQETLTVNDVEYYYLTSNYLFAPATESTIETSFKLLPTAGGEPIKSLEFKGSEAITLKANCKTNVLGSMVQQPVTWSVWDGNMPGSDHKLTTDNQNRYIIDEAADIAWLTEYAEGLQPDRTFIMTIDIDMNNFAIASSINLPARSTFDGNEHIIKNLRLTDALFGNATNLTVRNLSIEEADIENTATAETHVGILVNTLKGSSSFTNVNINNSSVSTENGAAGGIVGYICGTKADDRNETLEVLFDNCHVAETTVDGESATGHFVGLLRGYDPNEHLTFNSNCTLTLSATAAQANDFVSPYREGNEGTWLAGNDYSKYDGWLGNEECYRGKVMLGGVQFIPCWDGTTKITPLTDGTTKLIYSPFDLASLQGTAAGSIRLMENVCMEYDLNGASKDDTRNHIFKALSTLTKLDGNGKTIYNISIRDNYYGGFVKSENCATTFENVTFDGADIRVTHDTDEGNAYVGTLRGFAYATTTINNVHVKNGYLYGVCKMGGLCGGIFSKITCTNSSVTNYDIENYDSQIVSAGFKANGEIGGLIGFITVLDASTVNEISNCTVSDNDFNCVTYSAIIYDRSVAPFIGDIRTQKAGTVKINNCEILGTNTYTDASNGKATSFDQHRKRTGGSWIRPTYTYYPLVGQCYAVILADDQGKVYIDNTQIF